MRTKMNFGMVIAKSTWAVAVMGAAATVLNVDSAWHRSGVTAVTASSALMTVEVRMIAMSL